MDEKEPSRSEEDEEFVTAPTTPSSPTATSDGWYIPPTSTAPDLWMLTWLDTHHETLVDGLQNIVQYVADYLVTRRHIIPWRSEHYQEIMLDVTIPLRKVHKLLELLRTHPPAVFHAFHDALGQDCFQSESVHHLALSAEKRRELAEESARDVPPLEKLHVAGYPGPAVLKASEELRKSYKMSNTVPMNAGFARCKTMTMDEILVSICLLSSEEMKKAFEKPSFSSRQDQERCEYLFTKILRGQPSFLSLEEVFEAKHGNPHKVVASGGAGCGKSVCFTRKAPYEWAFGRLWKQFVLLFCLELRDESVWQAKTLPELLKLAWLGLTPEEQEEVRQFITNHPDKVVIICDGLDEGADEKSSLLWHLLLGNCTGIPSTLRVVVTTRPCAAADKLTRSTSYRGVEVVGFTEDNIAQFARKYLGEEPGKKLLSLLQEQPSVASMMHAPLFCLLVCSLFEKEKELPTRITAIFKKIVVALMQLSEQDGCFQHWEDAPPSLKEAAIELGKIAFKGLQKKQLCFTEVELKEDGGSDAAKKLGLLVKSESTYFDEPGMYAFLHLTFQEFLAALYVSSEVLKTDADMAELLKNVKFDDGHLSTFWVFLAGLLSDDKVDALLCTVLQFIPKEPFRSFLCTLQVYRCFAESDFAERGEPSASVGRFLETTRLSMDDSDYQYHLSDINTVMRCHSEHISDVSFILYSLSDSMLDHLLSGLQHCRFIRRLSMHAVLHQATPRHYAIMGGVLAGNAATLEEIEFGGIADIDGDHWENLSVGLIQCQALKKLTMMGVQLHCSSGVILGKVLRSLPNLEELVFNATYLTDTLEVLAEYPSQCNALKKLRLSYCGLNDTDGAILCKVLCSLPSLEELKVTAYRFGVVGLEKTAEGLRKCKTLKKLVLSPSRMDKWDEIRTSRQAAILGDVLCSLPSLEELTVTLDRVEDVDLDKLAKGLQKCKTLKKLGLESHPKDNPCGIWTSGYGVILGDVLCSLPSLEELAIYRCNLGDFGLKQMAEGLRKCKALKKLVLTNDPKARSRTSRHGAILGNVLCSLPSLEELDVYQYRLGDVALEQMAEGLGQCKALKELFLSYNELTSRSGAILGNVLCNLSGLEVLDVKGNSLEDSGLEQMAEGLRQCKALKKLNLSHNQLVTSRSGEILASVLSSLPSFEHLVAYGNDLWDVGREKIREGLKQCKTLKILEL